VIADRERVKAGVLSRTEMVLHAIVEESQATVTDVVASRNDLSRRVVIIHHAGARILHSARKPNLDDRIGS